ncbi:MAG: type III-B CRISPR module-associated Cmr3 family protein [Anaerolineae bacterium]
MMDWWLIEPHDPLIVRDGRPFQAFPGARARPLDFPFPSTIAGGIRTRAGQKNGAFDTTLINQVKAVGIRGPLLVELGDGDQLTFLVPAPGDALLIEDAEKGVVRHRLRPLDPEDALSDMPNHMPPVGLVKPDLRKPYKKAPRFWKWDKFEDWLANPPDEEEVVAPAELGHSGPGKEWRVHVKMDPNTFTGEEGMLFATGGLEFFHKPEGEEKRLSEVKRLALATAVVENPHNLTIAETFAPLGGERRIMRWRKAQKKLEMPNGLVEQIAKSGFCRLVLLTPAHFTNGWQPEWLLETRKGVTPKLETAVIGKCQTVSGWDFENRSPKPTRRLVPAGSVFYLALDGSEAARKAWAEAMWLANVSDTEDDRLAGFGLAALGVWDGKAWPVEVDNE